jgi:hypothetical protein
MTFLGRRGFRYKQRNSMMVRTSIPGTSHRTGPQPSDFKMLGHQPSGRII